MPSVKEKNHPVTFGDNESQIFRQFPLKGIFLTWSIAWGMSPKVHWKSCRTDTQYSALQLFGDINHSRYLKKKKKKNDIQWPRENYRIIILRTWACLIDAYDVDLTHQACKVTYQLLKATSFWKWGGGGCTQLVVCTQSAGQGGYQVLDDSPLLFSLSHSLFYSS